MRNFKGKNVLITGGASGIGLAIARELIKEGANIHIFDLNMEGLEPVVEELRSFAGDHSPDACCRGVEGDVTDFSSLKNMVDQMEKSDSPVDLLINSAGITHPAPLWELDVPMIKKIIDIDLLGTVYACRAVLPGMIQREGERHIVIISSIAGLLGVYGYSAYGAAKYGVRGLGEVLRQELKPHGIGVTILYPPDTDTPQFEYENRYKPDTTKAISGTIKPVSAEYVAKCLIKGIRKNRFQLVPTFMGKTTGTAAKLFTPLLRKYLDSVVKKVARTHSTR